MIRLLAPHNIYRIGGFILDTQKKCLGGYSTSKSRVSFALITLFSINA